LLTLLWGGLSAAQSHGLKPATILSNI